MYSYSVAGANIFGQWFSDDLVIEGFEKVTNKLPDVDFNLENARLVHATWSYNIFEMNGVFYIAGCWFKKEKQLVTIPLPYDFPSDCITMLVTGNDKNVVLMDAEKQIIFVMDLKFETRVKRINLYCDLEEEGEPVPKRSKKNNQMVKVTVTNNSCMYMRFVNRAMKVYIGFVPRLVNTDNIMGRVIDVQCGYEHYMLLTDTGKVYTWGHGGRLQLGHGGLDDVMNPREVRALAGFNIKKIRAGGWHSAVVSEFGDLYMWGWNDVGQLGIKTRSARRKELRDGPSMKKKRTHPISTVVDIYDEELNSVTLDVIDVCCGTKHTVLMLSDYSVWAAGSNEYGQLGLPIKDCTHKEYYVKVYQGTKDTILRCGPWTTILEN